MTVKWTKRKSGEIRTTIRVAYHIPKPMVEFLQEHARWSEAKALHFIRYHIAKLSDGWDTIRVDAPAEGEDEPTVYIDSFDSVREYPDEVLTYYEGPTVA